MTVSPAAKNCPDQIAHRHSQGTHRTLAERRFTMDILALCCCPGCHKKYDNSVHTPKCLPCGHSACLSCLESFDPLHTPRSCWQQACPAETEPLPCDVASLATNLAILTIATQPVMPRCDVHGCEVCLYCVSCAKVHPGVGTAGMRQALTKRTVRAVASFSQMVCTACVATNHKEHAVTDLLAAAKTQCQRLEDATAAGRRAAHHAQSVLQTMRAGVNGITASQEECAVHIDAAVARWAPV